MFLIYLRVNVKSAGYYGKLQSDRVLGSKEISGNWCIFVTQIISLSLGINKVDLTEVLNQNDPSQSFGDLTNHI